MGCCGDREKGVNVSEEQRWDYITLSDFKSKSCLAPFSYMWLLVLALISVAVYAADTFTAVNLVAFDRWSSQVQPAVPFEVSKWIFFGCICFSWALAALEWLRAIRVIRGGGVADSYLDPLAAVIQSMRLGKGQGWRRFLVFAELTTSKKGTDYIALFVYFQFKGAIRIIFAEGPRQVINAVTLYSVMKLQLIPEGKHAASDGRSTFEQFFVNIEALADSNAEQAVILSSMLFTLVIWVIAALSLIIASILYILFLWHYIPSADGTLSRYCRRKVDGRLDKIVSVKVKKALQRQEAKRIKEERKAAVKNGEKPGITVNKQPTLPSVMGDDDAKSIMSGISGNDSYPTLPSYHSAGPTRTNTMSTTTSTAQGSRRPFPPSRSDTGQSNASYSSNAPLLGDASPMGYDDPSRARSPVPPLPRLNTADSYGGPPPGRPYTPGGSATSGGPQRPFSPMSRPGTAGSRNGPMRQNTGFSNDGRNSPGPMGPPGPMRQNTFGSMNSRNGPGPSPLAGPTFSPYDRRAPGPDGGPSFEMSPVEGSPLRPQPSFTNNTFASPISDDYDPYRPQSTDPVATPRAYTPQTDGVYRGGPTPQPRPLPSAVLQSAIQRREASNPLPSRGGATSVPPQAQRSATAPMGGPMYPQTQSPVNRSATAGPPANGRW